MPAATPSRPHSRLRIPAILMLLVLLVAPFPAAVASDHGGRPIGALFSCDRPVTPPRCTSVGDNPRHMVLFDASLTEGLAISMREAMAHYGATELIFVEQTRLSRMTDVIVFSQDYGDNGAAGWVYCPTDAPQGVNPLGDRWCRQQELHLNLNPRYGIFFADDGSRDHVTCHELGHTLGLRHWGNPPQTSGTEVAATCMNANTPDGPATLHQVDIDHINAYAYRQSPPRRHQPLREPSQIEPRELMPWHGFLQATELEAPTTLAELTRSSDAVVRGRIVALTPGRVFGDGDALLHYASATLRVDELVAGALPPRHAGSLTLEVPLFAGPDSIDTLPAWGEGLFFLRNKAESARAAGLSSREQAAEADYYRLVTFSGLIANHEGVAVASPDAPYVARLDGTPFPEVVEDVRLAGR